MLISGETRLDTIKPTKNHWIWIAVFFLAGAPSLLIRISGFQIEPTAQMVILGLGIVSGAFLISWGAEVAQIDISASFAIAILALVALLPEYSIEAVLAWDAGSSFNPLTREFTKEMERVAANVTGANRLLIGLGWSLVVLIFWFKRRQYVTFDRTLDFELLLLAMATIIAFLIFFMGQVNIVLAAILILIYFLYLWLSSRKETQEPHLTGPSLLIGSFPRLNRHLMVLIMFLYSAAVIFASAEPFVESLVETGVRFGIDEFILIQWVAPLASESPEIIIAILFSLKSNPVAGLTTLISAEISQLTLLVSSMVGIFSLSAGELLSFPLDTRQSVEFLLTASVSLFAILLLVPRKVGWQAGLTLLGLFVIHLFFNTEESRLAFSFIYLACSGSLVALYWLRHYGVSAKQS